jgi:lipopolysaccharide biosynthesis glycosyltransferase
MDIAISFDRNYLNPFYALITSIFENNKDVNFHFHCIVRDDVTFEERNEIELYIKKNNGLFFTYEVDENLIAKFVISGTWTTAVYYKIFFPLLVPKRVSRLLYLDTDMLVIGDLKPLFELDLGGFALGAVYDNYVMIQPEINIIEEGKYFNSGMLLFNVPKWKDLKLSEKAINFLSEYPSKIKFVDQCALNAVSKDLWLRLPEKYNLLYSYIPQNISQNELIEYIKDKVVVHFTLHRPWHLLCKNRLRSIYIKYMIELGIPFQSRIIDFSIWKIPSLLKLRLVEFYFDSFLLQQVWRFFKINK